MDKANHQRLLTAMMLDRELTPGRRLAIWRACADPCRSIGQRELAKKLSVERWTVASWEHGQHRPKESTRRRIQEYTGIPVWAWAEAPQEESSAQDLPNAANYSDGPYRLVDGCLSGVDLASLQYAMALAWEQAVAGDPVLQRASSIVAQISSARKDGRLCRQ